MTSDAITRARAKKQAASEMGEAERGAYHNEIHFSGNLGRDFELFEGENYEVAKSSLAVWQRPRGGVEQPAMWFDLVLWHNTNPKYPTNTRLFERALDLEKGAKVEIIGRLTMTKGKDGTKYYSIDVTDIL